MIWIQKEIQLKPRRRGFHLISDEILAAVPEMARLRVGQCMIFIKHTSASLTLNENADPTVRADFRNFFDRCVPEDEPYYQHDDEGSDDLPAHIKSSLLGSSVSLPITAGEFNCGVWQGVYLCEHRNQGGSRRLVITIMGENADR